jgi:hypothetical protein
MINVGRTLTPDIPSQLAPGEHVVIFHGGPRLFMELDRYACDQLGPLKVLDRAGAELREFGDNHPVLAQIASLVGAVLGIGSGGIPIAAHELWKSPWLVAMRVKDPAAYAALTTTAKAGGIITLYIAAYIAIRWTQLIVTSRNSRDGGVLIEFGPPYWPLQVTPTIWPRGGPGERLDNAVDFVADAGGNILDNAREKAQAARRRIPGPVRARRFGRR